MRSGPLPRLKVRHRRWFHGWAWGCYLTEHSLESGGLSLLLYLGSHTLIFDLTWPERSKP